MANVFALEIVTPQEIFYQDDVEMVITRTTQGDRAVLKNHIPFVAGLVDGELRIKKDGSLKSGMIEIVDDRHITIDNLMDDVETISLADIEGIRILHL